MLNYSYTVTLNSAASMSVTAEVTADDGASVGSGSPYSHTASGTSPVRDLTMSWSSWPTTLTLTLTGTYEEKGVTKTLTASASVPVPEEPFTDPTITITYMDLGDIEEFAGNDLTYAYTVDLGSASSMTVSAVVTDENEFHMGQDDDRSFTASGGHEGPIELEFDTGIYVTLTLTGTYEEKGVTKTVTATKTSPVTLAPDLFEGEGRVELGTSMIYYYGLFIPRFADPHISAYDFEVVGFTVHWTDDAETDYGTADLTADAISVLEYDQYRAPGHHSGRRHPGVRHPDHQRPHHGQAVLLRIDAGRR